MELCGLTQSTFEVRKKFTSLHARARISAGYMIAGVSMVATIFPHGNSIMYYGYVKFDENLHWSRNRKIQSVWPASIHMEEIVSRLFYAHLPTLCSFVHFDSLRPIRIKRIHSRTDQPIHFWLSFDSTCKSLLAQTDRDFFDFGKRAETMFSYMVVKEWNVVGICTL